MIVVLNGASSAGKTTLARAVQDAWTEPALLWGIDTVVGALPRRYLGPRWASEVYTYEYDAAGAVTGIGPGPYGDVLMRGLHAAVAALARSGHHVIMDHVVLAPSWGADLVAAFAGLDRLLVHVFCPLDELERREQARRDRTVGQARAHYAAVAGALAHDLVVDTSVAGPARCAASVLAAAHTRSVAGGSVRRGQLPSKGS